jgi:hypothetical protein
MEGARRSCAAAAELKRSYILARSSDFLASILLGREDACVAQFGEDELESR